MMLDDELHDSNRGEMMTSAAAIPPKAIGVRDRSGDTWLRIDAGSWRLDRPEDDHLLVMVTEAKLIAHYGPVVPIRWATSTGVVTEDPDAAGAATYTVDGQLAAEARARLGYRRLDASAVSE